MQKVDLDYIDKLCCKNLDVSGRYVAGILRSSIFGGMAIVIDIKSMQIVLTTQEDCYSIVLSPCGAHVALMYSNGFITIAQLRDSIFVPIYSFRRVVITFEFNYDGAFCVVYTSRYQSIIISTHNGKVVGVYDGRVDGIAIDSECKNIAIYTYLWGVSSISMLRFNDHVLVCEYTTVALRDINRLCISGDGRNIVSVTSMYDIYINRDKIPHTYLRGFGTLTSNCIVGNYLVSIMDHNKRMIVYNITERAIIYHIEIPNSEVYFSGLIGDYIKMTFLSRSCIRRLSLCVRRPLLPIAYTFLTKQRKVDIIYFYYLMSIIKSKYNDTCMLYDEISYIVCLYL